MKKILIIFCLTIFSYSLLAQQGTNWPSMRNKVHFRDSVNIDKGWMIDSTIILPSGIEFNYVNGVTSAIQAHQTQSDWTPVATLGILWKIYTDPLSIAEWRIGVAYKINDIVTYQTKTYKCLQAHTSIATWYPSIVPALWQLQ